LEVAAALSAAGHAPVGMAFLGERERLEPLSDLKDENTGLNMKGLKSPSQQVQVQR
jgi:hypothetical protein